MSIKHTVRLTRKEAEAKYVELVAALSRPTSELTARALGDTDLEDLLERLNDAANSGEGFENYQIQKARAGIRLPE